MHFQEDFLHFVWQFKLFDALGCKTSSNEPVEIIEVGNLNKNAGPDFINAKIKIGEFVWVGNVEIHVKSSEWERHGHQQDKAYQNVILHVVLEDDKQVRYDEGVLVPTLELKGRFSDQLLQRYKMLLASRSYFPCQEQISSVDSFLIDGFLFRVLIERLEQKSERVFAKLALLKDNWDEIFYQFMAANFGFHVNTLNMEMLAQSLPQYLFAKHKNNPIQIEALLFGQAGFLTDDTADDYYRLLQQEYQFLAKKYSLKPIDKSLWKFLRMRPQNFPTLRLAQFAALIINSNHLFSKILEIKNFDDYRKLFSELPVNTFWEKHYHFNKSAKKVSTQLGKKSIENILINTIALFLYAYGRQMDKNNYITQALQLLETLPAEENVIIKKYAASGVIVKNACQSQAVLQLHKNYCSKKRCLNCGIGIKILKR